MWHYVVRSAIEVVPLRHYVMHSAIVAHHVTALRNAMTWKSALRNATVMPNPKTWHYPTLFLTPTYGKFALGHSEDILWTFLPENTLSDISYVILLLQE